jgi:hypothetical protein
VVFTVELLQSTTRNRPRYRCRIVRHISSARRAFIDQALPRQWSLMAVPETWIPLQ